MGKITVKIDFPRTSPEGIISMGKNLLQTYDVNPEAVNVGREHIELLRNHVAAAEEKRIAAKQAFDLSVKLNGEADKLLGISIGQTLEDDTTVVGAIATFRNHAQLTFKKDIEKLRDYGFSVKLSTPTPRITKAVLEKAAKKQ
jgi:hypothetical protein